MTIKKRMTLLGMISVLALGVTALNKEETVLASEGNYHTVVSGETLWRIATTNGYDVNDVAEYNHMNKSETINPKDKIYFPEVKKAEKRVAKKVVSVEKETRNYGSGLLDWQYAILCAVVQQESVGLTSVDQLPDDAYASALAVMSSITNRVDANTYYGKDVYGVISAPSQYESFGAKHYEQQLGNILDVTKQAVNDGLKGKKSHNYLNFRSESYAKAYGFSGVDIGGNVYFND